MIWWWSHEDGQKWKDQKQLNRPVLSLEEASHLILETKRLIKSIGHFRDHAIICLMLVTGLRVEEVVHAKRFDYETRDGITDLHIRWKRCIVPCLWRFQKVSKKRSMTIFQKEKIKILICLSRTRMSPRLVILHECFFVWCFPESWKKSELMTLASPFMD